MKGNMEPTTKTKFYFLLRFWHRKTGEHRYVYNSTPHYQRREWWMTDKRSRAYVFGNRRDAKGALRGTNIKSWLEKEGSPWFWEIVRVTETIVTTYQLEIVGSDAPAMAVLGRSAL